MNCSTLAMISTRIPPADVDNEPNRQMHGHIMEGDMASQEVRCSHPAKHFFPMTFMGHWEVW